MRLFFVATGLLRFVATGLLRFVSTGLLRFVSTGFLRFVALRPLWLWVTTRLLTTLLARLRTVATAPCRCTRLWSSALLFATVFAQLLSCEEGPWVEIFRDVTKLA